MEEVKFPQGLFINSKRENAPDFVLGSLSIRRDEFISWLKDQKVNEKDYLNIDILKSKEGKSYLKLNEWQPSNDTEGF